MVAKKKKRCIYQLMLSAVLKFSTGFTKVEEVKRPHSQSTVMDLWVKRTGGYNVPGMIPSFVSGSWEGVWSAESFWLS